MFNFKIDLGLLVKKIQLHEFTAYAFFVVLFVCNYFVNSSVYSLVLLALATCLAINYKPILMLVPCMISDTLQGYFMITESLSFNRALALLFILSCLIHYREIRITSFFFVQIYLAIYVVLTSLWSVTGAFNESISFLISIAMIILMEGHDDVDKDNLYRLFSIAFVLYGLSLSVLTYMNAGSIMASQVVFDESFNANTICSALALSASVVYGCYSIGKGFNKLISYGFVALCVVSILLVGSRTSFIGLVISIVVTNIVANKYKGRSFNLKTIIAFVLAVSVLALVVYFIMHNNPDIYYRFTFSSQNRLDMESVTRRTDVWDALIEYVIPENIFFGVGFGLLNIKTIVAPYVFHAHHAHNMFLAIVSETGLVGLALFALFFVHYVKEIVISRNIDKIFLVSILSFAFIDGFGEEMINQRWMWITFGLCGVLLKSKNKIVLYDRKD